MSEVTARDYRYVIETHLLPVFGNRRLNEITTALVKECETKLKRRGYALATVKRIDRRRTIIVALHA